MKTTTLFKFLFVICTTILLKTHINAQVKYINGKFGINNANPSYSLDLEGQARFSNWTDVYLDWSGSCSSPVIYPQTDWYLQLGKDSRKLGTMYIYGIHSNHYWNDSDERVKENITGLDKAIDKLKLVRPVKFNFKQEHIQNIPAEVKQKYQKTMFGFSAQELEKVFPELVMSPDTSYNIYSINYIGMIPVLVEAIQEQQKVIETLQTEIATIQTNCCPAIKSFKSGNTINNVNSTTIDDNSEQSELYQNSPNPFNETTEIGYYLPQNISNAVLYIYDMQGKQINQYPVYERENGSITITGGTLTPGMYMYALIADGKEVDTKRMILTE